MWGGGAKPSSHSAECEIPQTAFFFCKLFFLRLWCQKEKWLRDLGDLRADDQWSPLRSNKASTSIASEKLFVSGSSRTSTPTINTLAVSKRKVAKEFRLFKGGRFVNRPYGQKNNQRQRVDDFDITPLSFVGEGSPLPKEKQSSMQKNGRRNASPTINFFTIPIMPNVRRAFFV